MGLSTRRALVPGTVAALLLVALPLAAQPAPRRGPMPMYDLDAEITLRGTVESLEEVEAPNGGKGIHLKLSVEGRSRDIHVGPAAFLQQEGFAFTVGDELEVTAAPCPMDDEGEALMPRRIVHGDETLVLRDERGVPLWSRGGHQWKPCPHGRMGRGRASTS